MTKVKAVAKAATAATVPDGYDVPPATPMCRPTSGLARSCTTRTATRGAEAQAMARTQSRRSPTANTMTTPATSAVNEPSITRSWAHREPESAGKA